MKCPHCGARHQEDGFKCEECGQMIHVEKKIKWRTIIIGTIILIVLGIAAYQFIMQSSNHEGMFADSKHDSFEEYTWEEIEDAAHNITMAGSPEGAIREAKKYGFVNDDGSLRDDLVKKVTLADGTEAEVQVIGLYHDKRVRNVGTAGLTFIIKVPVALEQVNSAATNEGGWAATELRTYLNGIVFDSLPDDMKNRISLVEKVTNNTGNTDSPDAATMTEEKVFPLSYVELMGTQEGNEGYAAVLNAEGDQYELLANDEFRASLEKKLAGDNSLNWWLRSPNPESTTQFYSQGTGYDTEQAYPLAMQANAKLSVVIGFCI